MQKSGANVTDQLAIKEMTAEGIKPELISAKLRIPLKCVKSFVPIPLTAKEQAQVDALKAKAAAEKAKDAAALAQALAEEAADEAQGLLEAAGLDGDDDLDEFEDAAPDEED